MSLARLSFQKALLLFCLPPTPSLHPLPKTGLKILPSPFLGFPTQLGPGKALKLEQGLGWGGRGYWCSWWEGAGGGNGQLSSQARGREQRSLGWPALAPWGLYSFPSHFPAKCLSFTPVFPLLVLHPWDRDHLLALPVLPWVSL